MQITLSFEEPLNTSLAIGDTIWQVIISGAGGYETAEQNNIEKIGTVEFVSESSSQSVIKISNYHDPNSSLAYSPDIELDNFIMFSKPNSVNTSRLKGYYAKVRLDNNSTEKVELFAVGSEISESSK